ncbi:hypothetical protein NliqN6_5238 [Naganishia liquefaciens]|uniref:RING-type domain-containing protein n=1 Tax=Naganishia liquefaciens TaxID=104408 RepID=A0A8H3TXQ4_9TREE|nr:hypothetical protein NliqN6_5238 [Naganishia liquefaciens]
METRQGRRSVIDLTAPSESPPEVPRPLIATAAIVPRRRLRDGSHSSRSSTATLSDVSGSSGAMIASGSRTRSISIDRRSELREHRRNGSLSSASESGSGAHRPAGSSSEGPRAKRARLGLDQDRKETARRSAGSGTASRTSQPSELPTRASATRAAQGSVEDFDVDSSDDALVTITGQTSAGGVVPDSDEEEEDKTDAMTVNTDLLDDFGNEIDHYQVVDDSSPESPIVPLRTALRPPEVEQITNGVNESGSANIQADEDEIEVVSHIKRSTDSNEAQEPKHGYREERVGVRRGKGKAPAIAHPDEPPENLLASFECPICFMPPVQAVLTPCGHIMCGRCLFDTLKSQAIREGKRPTEVGQYPPIRRPPGKRRTKKEIEWESSRPPLKGRILSGSCPVCRMELTGGFGTVPGEGGVKYLEIRTVTEL